MAKKQAKILNIFIKTKNKLKYIQEVTENSKTNLIILILSSFITGLGAFCTKQKIKGIILFGIEIGYFIYMFSIGFYDIGNFITLRAEGYPSTTCLIYGLLAIFITLGFISIHISAFKNTIKNMHVLKEQKNPNSFSQDLKSLKEGKFYLTILTLPIIGVIAFTVLPLVFMICLAFTSYGSPVSVFDWDGFNTFKGLLTYKDKLTTLLSITGWTFIWAILATFTCYFGGILLALIIKNKYVKCKGLWRTLFIITMATPQFVSLLVMRQMFAKEGVVNLILTNLGIIENSINFWGDTNNIWLAKGLIILINMWVGIPYQMVLLYGIIDNIPEELYESARLEGANKWQIFTRITMPYLLFVTAPLLISQFVSNINNFNVIYLLNNGGPTGTGLYNAGGTDILITWLYKMTKSYYEYNLSAAVGIIIFIINITISLSIYRNTASYKREGELA